MNDNRQEILRRAARIAAEKAGSAEAPSTGKAAAPAGHRGPSVDYKPRDIKRERAPIVLYGAPGSFVTMMTGLLGAHWEVKRFDDSEAAIGYCLDHPPANVVLDMDEPTDWRKSTDIFAAVSMMAPQTRLVICAADPDSTPVATLAAKGAVVASKPVSSEMLNEQLRGK